MLKHTFVIKIKGENNKNVREMFKEYIYKNLKTLHLLHLNCKSDECIFHSLFGLKIDIIGNIINENSKYVVKKSQIKRKDFFNFRLMWVKIQDWIISKRNIKHEESRGLAYAGMKHTFKHTFYGKREKKET